MKSVIKSKKLRDSARGQDCTLRLVGICNFNPETTVLAHIGRNRGMGQKCNDTMAVFACSSCHTEIDSVNRFEYGQDKLDALERTQQYWINEGLLNAK